MGKFNDISSDISSVPILEIRIGPIPNAQRPAIYLP
jgi:hypothetical protein